MTNTNDTALIAQEYISRGWAVIQLHDVARAVCSCGSADEPNHSKSQGGKHPIGGGWQNAGMRDPELARRAWAGRPEANIGIVTGRASGIWVLDVDPEHGGDEKLAALCAEHGALPQTYVVQTGSGGRHYYFLMPGFDFTTSRGQLPVGLDVRGNRGQVVAPPSFTLKGTYRVIVDVPIAPAPEWLLAMIRPSERVEVDAGEWAGSGLPAVANADRGGGYARAAVERLLYEMSAAPPGTRNDTAYRVGRRLAELVASGWSRLDGAAVFASFMNAALVADVDGGFSQTEAEQTLRKAIRDQGGRGVALPEADFYGTVWTPPEPVFPPGTFDATGNGGGQTDFDQAGQGPASPFTSPGAYQASVNVDGQLINGPIEQGEVVDPWELAVTRELSRLLVGEEAKRRAQALRDGRSPIEIMDREALLKMPRSQPLIAGWLGRKQTARLYGPPGAGKSFAAIEMAACIAEGRPWHGYATHQGEVVYFAVEDAEGVALRLRAWELHHETQHQVHVVSTPVQLNVPTVHRILAAVRAYFDGRHLALIVLDTQAMVTIGMDENSAQDMGVFVEAVKLLAAQTGATILTVHHSGVKGGRARGSTSVRGAMDVEIEASMAGATCTLSSTKQKNVGTPPAIMAGLNVIDVGEVDELGTAITSCVLLTPDEAGPFTSPAGPALSPMQRRALAIATALVETAATGETYARLRVRAADMTDFGRSPAGITSSFSRAWAYLVERGRIAKAQGREAYYFIDIDGLDRLSANPYKVVRGGPEVYLGEGISGDET